MDDPKKRAVKSTEFDVINTTEGMELQEQIASLKATVNALLAQQKSAGLDENKLEAILMRVSQMSADAAERAANPSNKTHPGISVFSYREGDRERPRPDLQCQVFWAGYPIDKDTTTAEEIELFNAAVPGHFTFTRTDHSRDQLTVIGTRDAAGNLGKLEFQFQSKENRESLPSMTAMLREVYKIKTPQELELERLRKEVEELRGVHA